MLLLQPVFQVAADGEDMTRWSEARFQKFSAERSSDEVIADNLLYTLSW